MLLSNYDYQALSQNLFHHNPIFLMINTSLFIHSFSVLSFFTVTACETVLLQLNVQAVCVCVCVCVCVRERESECVACVFWLGLTLIAFFCCCYFPLRPSGDFIVCVFVCRGCFFVLSWLWGSLVCPWLCSIDPRIAVLCHG